MKENPSKPHQNPIVEYFVSAFSEFGKVTWPTKEQAAMLTGIVVGVSFVLAIAIGGFDFGLSEGYKYLLTKLSTLSQ
ncbi:MAG: preprotein translocase subunit SecE [Candidatus Gracilibacteria bacterium]